MHSLATSAAAKHAVAAASDKDTAAARAAAMTIAPAGFVAPLEQNGLFAA
jgi:hypothetical protein